MESKFRLLDAIEKMRREMETPDFVNKMLKEPDKTVEIRKNGFKLVLGRES